MDSNSLDIPFKESRIYSAFGGYTDSDSSCTWGAPGTIYYTGMHGS